MISVEPLDAFSPKFHVVGCFVECEGEILLLHRNPEKFEGEKWGMPAGKVDPGETTHEAMLRELKEETGIQASAPDVEFLTSLFVRNNGTDLVYHMYRTRLSERAPITISPNEHQAFRWITPTEAMSMPLIHDLDACIEMYYSV